MLPHSLRRLFLSSFRFHNCFALIQSNCFKYFSFSASFRDFFLSFLKIRAEVISEALKYFQLFEWVVLWLSLSFFLHISSFPRFYSKLTQKHFKELSAANSYLFLRNLLFKSNEIVSQSISFPRKFPIAHFQNSFFFYLF